MRNSLKVFQSAHSRVSNSNSAKAVKEIMSEIHLFYRTTPPYSIAGVGTHQGLDNCIYNGS